MLDAGSATVMDMSAVTSVKATASWSGTSNLPLPGKFTES